jgi:hypothetical protein
VKAFTVFSTTTGLPIRQGFTPTFAFLDAAGPNEKAVEGNLGNNYYWDTVTQSVVPRGAVAATVSATTVNQGATVTIASLPAAAVLIIDGTTVNVPDGILNFTPTDPGYYYIQLNMKQYAYRFWTIRVLDTTPVPF